MSFARRGHCLIPATSVPLPLQTVSRSKSGLPHKWVGARHVYAALLGEHGSELGAIDEVTQSTSRSFLGQMLESAAGIQSDIPGDPRALKSWLESEHRATTGAYRGYLDDRRAGAPRRFFRSRSHALHFLKSVAPTKLVDGAWLYGLLPRWNDFRLAPLVRIYLEELGYGVPEQHHVLLYRQLLSQHGADRWNDLDDAHYVQGAIQLSLAHHAREFLPEVIGFTLGYEQLPLHLPISAHELAELGLDPYYFSLHVTIDNASTGHARRALQAALDSLPRAGDADAFYRRLRVGFMLNDVGMGTAAAIDSFDLDHELESVLADKARIGAELHSGACRIGGRAVSDWLAEPGGIPAFLAALVAAGWIRRGADPSQSRFWHLLKDERAPMFGVFDDYETQLISDWIADGSLDGIAVAAQPTHVGWLRRSAIAAAAASSASGAAADAGADAPGAIRTAPLHPHRASAAQTIRRHLATANARVDDDIRALAERVGYVTDTATALALLRGFMSPANHPSPAGLLATRICSDLIGR
ncbi:MAG: iron-containing redox enzyme family protein [Caldimonas sp.]